MDWGERLTMQSTMCFKNNEGVGQLCVSQAAPLPWWAGSQPLYGESFGQLKPLTVDPDNGRNSLPVGTGQMQCVIEQRFGPEPASRENRSNETTNFISFSDNNSSGKEPKTQQLSSYNSMPAEHQGRFELGLGQSMVSSNYPYFDPHYGLFAPLAAQTAGRMLLPMNMPEEGPIYVNAKQYHRIMQRRQARAKAEMQNKFVRTRKPYLHESRHRHALNRARGCGGRFLNKKDINGQGRNDCTNSKEASPSVTSAMSQISEILQSDNGNQNSTGGSLSLAGSEATSMYMQEDVNQFQVTDLLRPSSFPLSTVLDGEHDAVISSKWGSAADGCCALKV